MEAEISKELYHTIKELTSSGKLKSFGFTSEIKNVIIDINGIENNDQFSDLEEELAVWISDNRFMFDATLETTIENDKLILKETNYVNLKDYMYDDSDILEMLELDDDEILKTKLGTNYEVENLELYLYTTINNESVELEGDYSLIYNVPDSKETIDLSADEILKSQIIESLESWAESEAFSYIDMINSDSLYQIKLEIDDSYLSTFDLLIYDKMTLKIIE
ncbi:hypothetical protein ACSVH5_02320 [Flavobacterium sp. RSSA_27]|uniref:hypothetical protein n=1 Tax=Flavobacterium sp. RSSA_27 TaxID=3447667 RepID=UPI003F3EF350